MRFFLLITVCFTLISCGHGAIDGSAAKGKNSDTKESVHALTKLLMEKCGINEQVGNVPEKTMAEVTECFKRNEEVLGKMSDEVVKEISDIITRSFNPDTIRAVIARTIETRLSPDDMRAVIAWLDSPLGVKLTAIEKEGSTPEAYMKMVEAVPTLKDTPDYEARLQLVHEIDQSVKATELIVDRMINMQVITLSAMGSAFPSMKLPSEEEVKGNFERNRKGITETIAKEIALSIFYTYRNVSMDELKEYIAFMKSDYGKRYHDVIQEGSNEAYTYCGRKFSEAVVNRMKTREGSKETEDPLSKAPSPSVTPQERK